VNLSDKGVLDLSTKFQRGPGLGKPGGGCRSRETPHKTTTLLSLGNARRGDQFPIRREGGGYRGRIETHKGVAGQKPLKTARKPWDSLKRKGVFAGGKG